MAERLPTSSTYGAEEVLEAREAEPPTSVGEFLGLIIACRAVGFGALSALRALRFLGFQGFIRRSWGRDVDGIFCVVMSSLALQKSVPSAPFLLIIGVFDRGPPFLRSWRALLGRPTGEHRQMPRSDPVTTRPMLSC